MDHASQREDERNAEVMRLLKDVRLCIEHGHLTLRTNTGWLLWERKLSDTALSSLGLDLEVVLKVAADNAKRDLRKN